MIRKGNNLVPDVTLKPVRSDDESFLLRVYASSRADELAQTQWTEEQKQAFTEMQFVAQWQDYVKRFPDSEQSVVFTGGIPAGRI